MLSPTDPADLRTHAARIHEEYVVDAIAPPAFYVHPYTQCGLFKTAPDASKECLLRGTNPPLRGMHAGPLRFEFFQIFPVVCALRSHQCLRVEMPFPRVLVPLLARHAVFCVRGTTHENALSCV